MALRDTPQTPADPTRPGDDGRLTTKPGLRSKHAAVTSTGHPRRSRETATTGGRSVSARLSPAEGEALEALKERHGFGSNSDALRALVRAASGMLEADPATTSGLGALRGELHEIGVSANPPSSPGRVGSAEVWGVSRRAMGAPSTAVDIRHFLPSLQLLLSHISMGLSQVLFWKQKKSLPLRQQGAR